MDLSTFLAAFLSAGAAIWRRLFGLRLLVVLLRGDIYNVGSSRDPLRLSHRSIGYDIATRGAVCSDLAPTVRFTIAGRPSPG